MTQITVTQLVTLLAAMPKDAPVVTLWGGEPRATPWHVWLSKAGYVVLADAEEACCSDESRPIAAPLAADAPTWKTPVYGSSSDGIISGPPPIKGS